MAEQQYAAAAPAPAGATASFFNPWEPPPTQAPPPSDPQLAERISLLIKHSVANGPAFLETVKTRQGNDPNFSFLYPHGEHHAYFRWALYCTCIAQPAAQPTQPQQFHAPPPHAAYPHGAAPPSAPPTHTPQPQQPAQAPAPVQPPVSSTALSPEVEAGFQQVLEALTGSKEAIKTAQAWFMACGPQAAGGLARMMAVRTVNGVQEFDRTLHVIYLANDILFKGVAARPAGVGAQQDPVASAFLPFLGPMLASAYNKSGKSEEARAKLSKILSYWGERGVYDLPTTAGIESSMTSTDNPPAALAISLAQAAAAAAAAAAAQAAASAAAQAQAAQLPPQVQQPPSGPWQATGALSPHGGYGAPPPAPWGAPGAGLGMPGAPPPQGAWPGAPPPPYGTPPPPGMPGMAPPGAPWGAAPPPHQHYAPPPPQGMPPQGMPMPPHGAPPPGHAAWGYQAPAPPGAPPPVQYAPPPDVSTSQRPTGFSSAPPPSSHHRQTGFSSAPPAGGVPPPFGMAPDMMQGGGNAQQQQEEVPPKEPVSSFNFPPGLLPGLCRQKKEAGADKYEPLDPDDIERIGLPPPPARDDYLASRLERFFAECRDYRPGLARADIEDPNHSWHRQRLKAAYEEDPEGLKQRWWRGGGRRHGGGRGEGRVHADGTYTGGGSHYAGLGVHVAAPAAPKPVTDADLPAGLGGLGSNSAPGASAAAAGGTASGTDGAGGTAGGTGTPSFDDMYASYRNIRSGGYHAMIMANSAKAQMMSVVPRGLGPPR